MDDIDITKHLRHGFIGNVCARMTDVAEPAVLIATSDNKNPH